MEAKKQNEFNLKKQIMDMESEERLRIDEITRKRDIEGIGAKTEATAKANLAAAPLVGQAEVATKTSRLAAAKTSNLYEEEAEADVRGQTAKLDARRKLEASRKEGEDAADKLAAGLKARQDKGIPKLEAEAEKSKYDAMITAGVPEAKAKALMAEYTAGDPLRKKQASDAIDAEIKALTTKMASSEYRAAREKEEKLKAISGIAEINAREAGYRGREKNERGDKTTITELKTKLTVAEDRLATELGVPRAKINEAKLVLEKKAGRGDVAAAKKLKDIEPYRNDVQRAQETISRWNVKNPSDSSSPSEKTSYDYVPGKGLVETKK
jgi:DNA-binding transcriptional regulator YiaG